MLGDVGRMRERSIDHVRYISTNQNTPKLNSLLRERRRERERVKEIDKSSWSAPQCPVEYTAHKTHPITNSRHVT